MFDLALCVLNIREVGGSGTQSHDLRLDSKTLFSVKPSSQTLFY